MGRIDTELRRIASTQRQLVTYDQLRAQGMTKRQLHWVMASGRLTTVHRGVHLVGEGPLTFEQEGVAACLACPDGVLSHSSAGHLLGVRKSARERLELTVPTGATCRLPRVKIHRSNRLDQQDIFHRIDGTRLTSPERLLFDQAGVLDGHELVSAMHDAVRRELTNALALREIGRRMATKGRRGARDFQRALATLDGEGEPVDSDEELTLARGLAGSLHLPRAFRQHWIRLRTGASVCVDFAFPDVRLAVEVDHSFWHAIPSRVQSDKARDIQLQRIGWTTSRVTELDLGNRVPSTVATLTDVYRELLRRAA